MKRDEKWYFAYASNLNISQMMRRVGEWTTSQRGHLTGYRLTFNQKSPSWGGFTATIEKTGSNTDRVDGVVYLLQKQKIDVLSTYEGFVPTSITVKRDDGSELAGVAVFVSDKPTPSGKPSEAYLQTIVEGLKQHGYEGDAIERVKRIADVGE